MQTTKSKFVANQLWSLDFKKFTIEKVFSSSTLLAISISTSFWWFDNLWMTMASKANHPHNSLVRFLDCDGCIEWLLVFYIVITKKEACWSSSAYYNKGPTIVLDFKNIIGCQKCAFRKARWLENVVFALGDIQY
jgi:hypothetical protein